MKNKTNHPRWSRFDASQHAKILRGKISATIQIAGVTKLKSNIYFFLIGTRSGIRTRTPIRSRILSPMRIPVPPFGHLKPVFLNYVYNGKI